VSELRSVLDQLGSIDPEEMTTEELAAEIAEAIYGQQASRSWSPSGSSRWPTQEGPGR
jgi:hypothetical protein